MLWKNYTLPYVSSLWKIGNKIVFLIFFNLTNHFVDQTLWCNNLEEGSWCDFTLTYTSKILVSFTALFWSTHSLNAYISQCSAHGPSPSFSSPRNSPVLITLFGIWWLAVIPSRGRIYFYSLSFELSHYLVIMMFNELNSNGSLRCLQS